MPILKWIIKLNVLKINSIGKEIINWKIKFRMLCVGCKELKYKQYNSSGRYCFDNE